MKPGIAPRLVLSHIGMVVLALSVFVIVLLSVTEQQAAAAGVRADQATALQLAPWIARYYRERGSWDGLETMLADLRLAPRAQMMMRGSMPRRAPAPDSELASAVEQPLLVLSRTGEVLVARDVSDRLVEAHRRTLERGVPIGDAAHPLGYLFLGAAANPERNPLHAPFVRTTRSATLVTSLVVLAAVAAASVVWTRWLVKPLRELGRAAAAMARGDYHARVIVPASGDEIAELAGSFNDMACEVEAQEEARRRFVADAAHELRTPLSLVSARVEMLASGVYPPDADQWSALQAGIGRMQRLVDDLQTLARLESGRLDLQRIDINAVSLIERSLRAFEPAAASRGIHLRAAAQPVWFVADPDRIDQVLANLISNAVRHAPANGVVTVGCEQAGTTTARLWVEDEGPGVPYADRERIFGRFVRLDSGRDRSAGGSGLGLAIATEIARLHKGSIRVDSGSGGRGARFIVEMPSSR